MYPLILCPTCGNSLGELYPAYREYATSKYLDFCKKNNVDVKPEFRFLKEVDINLGDILDKLEIKSDCCRTVMISQVLFRDVY